MGCFPQLKKLLSNIHPTYLDAGLHLCSAHQSWDSVMKLSIMLSAVLNFETKWKMISKWDAAHHILAALFLKASEESGACIMFHLKQLYQLWMMYACTGLLNEPEMDNNPPQCRHCNSFMDVRVENKGFVSFFDYSLFILLFTATGYC